MSSLDESVAAVAFEAGDFAASLRRGLPFAVSATCVLFVYFPEDFCFV